MGAGAAKQYQSDKTRHAAAVLEAVRSYESIHPSEFNEDYFPQAFKKRVLLAAAEAKRTGKDIDASLAQLTDADIETLWKYVEEQRQQQIEESKQALENNAAMTVEEFVEEEAVAQESTENANDNIDETTSVLSYGDGDGDGNGENDGHNNDSDAEEGESPKSLLLGKGSSKSNKRSNHDEDKFESSGGEILEDLEQTPELVKNSESNAMRNSAVKIFPMESLTTPRRRTAEEKKEGSGSGGGLGMSSLEEPGGIAEALAKFWEIDEIGSIASQLNLGLESPRNGTFSPFSPVDGSRHGRKSVESLSRSGQGALQQLGDERLMGLQRQKVMSYTQNAQLEREVEALQRQLEMMDALDREQRISPSLHHSMQSSSSSVQSSSGLKLSLAAQSKSNGGSERRGQNNMPMKLSYIYPIDEETNDWSGRSPQIPHHSPPQYGAESKSGIASLAARQKAAYYSHGHGREAKGKPLSSSSSDEEHPVQRTGATGHGNNASHHHHHSYQELQHQQHQQHAHHRGRGRVEDKATSSSSSTTAVIVAAAANVSPLAGRPEPQKLAGGASNRHVGNAHHRRQRMRADTGQDSDDSASASNSKNNSSKLHPNNSRSQQGGGGGGASDSDSQPTPLSARRNNSNNNAGGSSRRIGKESKDASYANSENQLLTKNNVNPPNGYSPLAAASNANASGHTGNKGVLDMLASPKYKLSMNEARRVRNTITTDDHHHKSSSGVGNSVGNNSNNSHHQHDSHPINANLAANPGQTSEDEHPSSGNKSTKNNALKRANKRRHSADGLMIVQQIADESQLKLLMEKQISEITAAAAAAVAVAVAAADLSPPSGKNARGGMQQRMPRQRGPSNAIAQERQSSGMLSDQDFDALFAADLPSQSVTQAGTLQISHISTATDITAISMANSLEGTSISIPPMVLEDASPSQHAHHHQQQPPSIQPPSLQPPLQAQAGKKKVRGKAISNKSSAPSNINNNTTAGGEESVTVNGSWTKELDYGWAEVSLLLRKPIRSEEDMLYCVAAAEAGIIFTDQMNTIAKQLHVLRGSLSRWLLPYDNNTRIDTQCSTPHSVVENMPAEFRGKLTERQVHYLVAGANEVRKLVRVKIADDNDLDQAREALKTTDTFFKRLYGRAGQLNIAPFALLQKSGTLM